jgi:cell division protease FtsH
VLPFYIHDSVWYLFSINDHENYKKGISFMNKLKKQILHLMMLVMVILPLQGQDQVPQPQKQSYFGKVGSYVSSDAGIEQMISITGSFTSSVVLAAIGAYVYMYVNQNTKDFIGNQTMQIYYPGDIKTTLDDVAGLSGAKADMQDILSYLKNPKAYKKMGAKVPKGVLMNGGPGNGKTLLAKAFAGTVNVPFISVAGSSFMQMYVGLGAVRVRDLFKKARQLSEQYGGCVIFIDEIDAVATKRSDSPVGAKSEHDQTVAQLLECMDGLESHQHPIIVLGATNRADLLDPAIKRPGRFDRKVEITKPQVKDRIALINIALEHVKYAQNINIEGLARITSGFSGAELAGLVNDAAILAVADKRKCVENKDLELAFDHITLGREITGMDRTNEDRWTTAIHEAGHAVGLMFGHNQKYVVHKASIIPRSKTLGIVYYVPLREMYKSTEDEMRARIVVALSGGLAEQAFGFDKSTGPRGDISQAFDIAYDMVAMYGMSEELNYIYDQKLPTDISSPIYKEAKKIVDECLIVAKDLIASHKTEIEMIAQLLMKKGTVLGQELYELVGLPLPTIEVSAAV